MVALLLLVAGCGGAASVVVPPLPPPLPVGVPIFGRNSYIEYIPGELPVVISMPHGGALTPASIPDRTVGTFNTDRNTIELGRAISAALVARTGKAPHLVMVHLQRTKLDANREVVEAAAGNADAIQAWTEYHAFVDSAKAAAVQRRGYAIYVDLHGHGHAIARLELGYLLSASELDRSDATISASYLGRSSLRNLPPLASPFAAIVRGDLSFGGLLSARGYPAVPSPAMPSPGSDPYFDGGYSTSRHTVGSTVGLQLECHFTGVRDTEANRQAFAAALAEAIDLWQQAHVRKPW